jgi:GH43 family beta-xylosidase
VTVPNAAAGSTLGAALVQNPSDSLWADNALTLSGGAKNSTGDWVRLPNELLTGKTSATVQMEVKADATMLNSFNFMWNIGNSSSDTEYFFATLNCANGRMPLVGLKTGGAENLVQASSCAAKAATWMSVTAVIDGSASPAAAKLYIDGVQVASGTLPATPAGVVDQSLSTIGRSPWPDALFKGAVSTFRVYDTALTANQVDAISEEDAALHTATVRGYAQAIVNGLDIDDQTVDSSFVTLPTAAGQVTWTSSDPATVSPNGVVTQPLQGQPAKTVTMTARSEVRGITATRSIALTVNPTTKTNQELVDEAATAYVIDPVMVSGDQLPAAAEGTSVTFENASGITVSSAGVVTGGSSEQTGTVEAVISKSGVSGVTARKTFTIEVLPEATSERLLAYDRVPTSENQANNGDIAYSMHLALEDGPTWSPLNENYGIFFARSAQAQPVNQDVNASLDRSLKDPSVFYLDDGGYGVVAVRTTRGSSASDSTSSILFATSSNLLEYEELINSRSIIDVGEANGVNRPHVVWDTAAEHYVVSWTDDSGVAKYTTFDDLVDSASTHGELAVGAPTVGVRVESAAGVENFRSGDTIAIDDETVSALVTRFGRLTNTGYTIDPVTVAEGSTVTSSDLPANVNLTYSDGSSGFLPISSWDTSSIDTSKPGSYSVTGTVKQTQYQLPFAEERADPSVYKWEWEHGATTETKYLMVATNDIYGDNVNQQDSARLPIRMSDTIAGLADTPGNASGLVDATGNNPKESVIVKEGDANTDGRVITGSLWAPEIHEIDGKLTILFMPSYNNVWTDGASAFIQLKKDANGDDLDPTKAANWSAPQTVTRANGQPLSLTATGGTGMSLDMTYFQDETGQSYYAWQQLGAVYIATMNPSDPSHVTSTPIRIVVPEYAWDNAIAEGPNVVTHDGKLYLIYSGSGVGKTYTTGMAIADASGDADLTDPASWSKLNYPIQKSGIFNGAWQLGTGHGMWSEDEDGNLLYVFHAYANTTEGFKNYSGRDMFVRRVHWGADGLPVLDMDLSEELASSFRTVTATVEVAPAAPVQSIAVTAKPTKTSYVVGDPFDATGLVVTATLTDGRTRALKPGEYSLSGFSSAAAGTSTVTVTMTAKPSMTATFTVAIVTGSLTTGVPTITGKAQVGNTLTAQPGAWGPAPVALSYQWLRDGKPIARATGASYELAAADRGHRVSVAAMGTKAGYGQETIASAPTAEVKAGVIKASRVKITGNAKAGHKLKATTSSWSPKPVTLSYKWYRDGKRIAGANDRTYNLKAADRGDRFTVKVTGKKSGYETRTRVSGARSVR